MGPSPDFKEEYMSRGERERRARESAMRDRMYDRPYYSQRRDRDPDSETESDTITDTGSENDADDVGRGPPRLFQGSNLSKGSKGSKPGKASKMDDSHGPLPRREWIRNATFTNGDNNNNNTANADNSNNNNNNNNNNSPSGGSGRNTQQNKRQKDSKRHWAEGPSPRGSVASRMESTDSLLAENGEAFSGFNTDGGGSSIHPIGHNNANSVKPVNGGGKRMSAMA